MVVEYALGQCSETGGLAVSEMAKTVKAMLVWAIRDELDQKLRVDIPTTDPVRVTRVVVGKYSDDITGIILVVHADHPLGFDSGRLDSAANTISQGGGTITKAWKLPVESIGGCRFEDEIITVEVRMLKDVAPQTAVGIVDEVKIRIRSTVEQMSGLVGTRDGYGNTCFAFEPAMRYGYASGGGDTSVNTFWCDFHAKVAYVRTML